MGVRIAELARVQANRLEQSIAPLTGGASFGGHERLLHEPGEHVRDPNGVELIPGAHALDRLELESASEHRQPTKQRPLVRLEKVVAPLHRGRERLLARRRRPALAPEYAEAIVSRSAIAAGPSAPRRPAASSIASGRPSRRPTSEAGELASTFNEMLDRLETERREATGWPGGRRSGCGSRRSSTTRSGRS